MNTYTILDIDNCIANDLWRWDRVAWQHKQDMFRRFHDYHSLSACDALGNRALIAGRNNIFLTSRPCAYRAITEEWLRRAQIPFAHLLMRNDNDHRSSVQVKADQLGWLLGGEYGPIHKSQIDVMYDDRADVVDMARTRFGINAHVRFINDPSKYLHPDHLDKKGHVVA